MTLPTIRNAVLAALLLGVARASGEVGITMMLGGNVADRTNTLSLEIFNAVGRGDFESATELCVVLAVTALVLYAAPELVCSKTISPAGLSMLAFATACAGMAVVRGAAFGRRAFGRSARASDPFGHKKTAPALLEASKSTGAAEPYIRLSKTRSEGVLDTNLAADGRGAVVARADRKGGIDEQVLGTGA